MENLGQSVQSITLTHSKDRPQIVFYDAEASSSKETSESTAGNISTEAGGTSMPALLGL